MATKKLSDRPKQVVYLIGAGATQAEVTYLGAKSINLLMRDAGSLEGVATRILNRLGKRWRQFLGDNQGADIEKLISLLSAGGVDDLVTLAEDIRRHYFLDIRKNLMTAGIAKRPELAIGLLEMHNNVHFRRHVEVLSGILTTNHDGLFQVASHEVFSEVNLGFPFESSDFNPNANGDIPPILQLHGSFTWKFGVPINVARLRRSLPYVQDYESFLRELDKVWTACFKALVPGGRLVCVVGDVCLSRRKNNGVHSVVPLHASIQEHCRQIGYTNLSPIIWNKIANAVYEASGNGGGFLGKPYEPNAVIKNDIEFILMERKPGGYRSPSLATRALSVISVENYQRWFQQIWTGLTGASTRNHPAPYPLELAGRLIRMFSFVGDTVLDPFMGTGTTNLAAAKWGRNSIGVELTPNYFNMAMLRLKTETASLFSDVDIRVGGASEQKSRYVVAPLRHEKQSKRKPKTTKAACSRKSAASKN